MFFDPNATLDPPFSRVRTQNPWKSPIPRVFQRTGRPVNGGWIGGPVAPNVPRSGGERPIDPERPKSTGEKKKTVSLSLRAGSRSIRSTKGCRQIPPGSSGKTSVVSYRNTSVRPGSGRMEKRSGGPEDLATEAQKEMKM